MTIPVIWFNRGLSQTGFLIQALRETLLPGEEYKIMATHERDDVLAASVADHFELEPRGLEGDEYVEWALEFVKLHQVKVLIAHAHPVSLSEARSRFSDIGCTLITAGSAESIRLLKSKTALYSAIREAGGLGIEIPECIVVHDVEALVSALETLRLKHPTTCFKPSVDLGGRGFRIVSDRGADFPQPYNGDALPMNMDDVRAYLATFDAAEFPEMMVMPYLNGPEHSLDCLAKEGELLSVIIRSKSQGGIYEVIDAHTDLVEQSRALTRLFQLNGLFNVQFLESETGVRYMLEINARMPGGIYLGKFAGVLLPLWAIRIALGTASANDIPVPRAGIKIDRATRTVIKN